MRAKVVNADRAGESATRDLLLRTASDIMTEQQSVDVSFREISERSGLNAALIKYYFGSKSGMMIALVVKIIGGSIARLDELLALDIPADRKIRIHIKAIVNTYFNYPFVNRLLHRVGRIENDRFGEELARVIVTPIYEAERRLLAQGVNQKLFRNVNPMFFYFHVTGACDAMFHSRCALQRTFKTSRITKKMKTEYADEISEIILHGITLKS